MTPTECVEGFLERIERYNPGLNAFITVLREEAMRDALERERELKSGASRGELHGIPVALKDNIMTKGVRTTAGSKLLADWVPENDASVVEHLRKAGAVIIGKTNLHEWAKGGAATNPFFGATKNPWNSERIPGGSSWGSASAVAASLSPAALGTDGAGSVRIPASFCGVVGFKPTYGLIPTYGIVDGGGVYGSGTLDNVGTFTRSSEDAMILLAALAKPDSRDRSSLGLPSFQKVNLEEGLKGVKVGVFQKYFFEIIAREVKEAIEGSLRVLERLGIETQEVSVPHVGDAALVWSVISRAEGWAAHERYLKSQPEGYSRPLLLRSFLGKFIDSDHYLRAQRLRSLLIEEFNQAFRQVDCILVPTTPVAAPSLDEWQSGYINVDGRKEEVGGVYGLYARCTNIFNLTGHPAVSIPCGFTSAGLPMGAQLVGRPFEDAKLLRVSHQCERASEWSYKMPPLYS